MNQKMYLITGLMACGKSTVSDLLAKEKNNAYKIMRPSSWRCIPKNDCFRE